MNRTRRFSLVLLAAACLALFGCKNGDDYERVDFTDTVRPDVRQADGGGDVVRVAVGAMISPGQTIVNYQEMVDYIGAKIGRDTRLVQRKTYAEVNEMLGKGDVDIAFICTGPFVHGRNEMGFDPLATPVVRGEPFYRAYLIVHKDSPFQRLSDLGGAVFAFTDPASNTGAMVPTHWLAQMHTTPDAFFKRVHFTYSHDNSILAVATGLVDGASVDGHIWEYYHQRDPVHTAKTRVIMKSAPFGSPPLVASGQVSGEVKDRVKAVITHMHEDPEGKKILDQLAIDRFDAFQEEWYKSVAEMKMKARVPALDHEKH